MIQERSPGMRILALVLGIALLAPILLYAFSIPDLKGVLFSVQAMGANPEEEARIAAEISNITGAATERIKELRGSGKGWNEILDLLRKGEPSESSPARAAQLNSLGLSDSFLSELAEKGYDQEAVEGAKALTERVQFQLSEIVGSYGLQVQQVDTPLPVNPLTDEGEEADEQNKMEVLQQIYGSFELEKAILSVLVFQQLAGSQEAALEAYFISLQLGIDLLAYETDWEAYEELKSEQQGKLVFITLSQIEDLMLERLQGQQGTIEEITPVVSPQGLLPAGTDAKTDSPVPVFQDLRPVNPAQQVLDEINQLNPNFTVEERLP